MHCQCHVPCIVSGMYAAAYDWWKHPVKHTTNTREKHPSCWHARRIVVEFIHRPPRINAAQVAITGQLDTALLDDEEWAQYQAAYAKHPDPVHAGAPGQ